MLYSVENAFNPLLFSLIFCSYSVKHNRMSKARFYQPDLVVCFTSLTASDHKLMVFCSPTRPSAKEYSILAQWRQILFFFCAPFFPTFGLLFALCPVLLFLELLFQILQTAKRGSRQLISPHNWLSFLDKKTGHRKARDRERKKDIEREKHSGTLD